ncbi:ESPR-type extended signal peptide-containing protein [Haemophilus sp. SZY H36]|uniref:ESPR-type extended signal peptide-containing protein n=1 Tax=Haemophilus sp. SZY H36 TaxID=2839968 RepID=UPI001C043855|nr:ESPR-type extended signal peptide-containing protein [Haemophilus sp. SZY H36]
MNKIFRVIWNHATQSWVAVSELASVKGKTKSKTISKLAALSLVTCSSIVAEHAMAATYINQTKVSTTIADATKQIAILQGSSQAAKSSNGTILISNNPLIRAGSVKIGFDIADNQDGNTGDTLIGNRISAGGQGGKDSMSTAVGYAAQVAGPAVSLGIGARADINDNKGWKAVSNSGVAIGPFSSIGGNRDGGVAIGAIAQADNHGSIAIGQLSGAYREFFDRDATSQKKGTVYRNAEADAQSTISIGKEAGARATSSIALGHGATTSRTGSNTIAFGTNSVAIKDNSIALGNSAVAGGYSKDNISDINTQLGKLKTDLATAEKNLGTEEENLKTTDTPEQKFRVASATATVARLKLAIKRLEKDLTYLESGENATNAIAIGNQAKATNQNSTALGNSSRANIATGVALGSSSETTAAKGITGFSPTTQGTSDIRANTYKPLDGRVLTSTLGGVSVGSATNTRQINHVAAGTADDDAVNVAQLRSVNLKIAGDTTNKTESAKKGRIRDKSTSKADVLLDSQTLNVVSSNKDLLTTDATNNTITITPKTTKVNVNNDITKDDSGKVSTPTTNGLVTATDLAGTLNNMYWKIAADKNEKGDVRTPSTEAVKAGDKVRLIAGDGVKIVQKGRDFTFSVKNVIKLAKADGSNSFFRAGPNMDVELKGEGKDQHVEYKLSPDITINSVTTNGGAKLEGTTLSGLSDHLVPTTPNEKAGTKPAAAAGDQLKQAATVNDVLNAGWNLQNNGEAKDFVKPYDTVNFVDGKGTKAVVESDHETSNVTFNVDTVDMTSTQNGTVENPMGNNAKKLLDDLAAAKKAVADNPDDEEARAKLKDAEDAVNKAGGNKIATAQNVANMINNSGFTLKADKVDGGENTTDGNNANGDKLTEKGELIKPGSTVTMKAGKNMAVKHDTNGNITYATASNVTFNSVQFGDNGPKITNNGENINVGTATGAPTKITGVAPGEISATSKDAVNGSQLYSVAKGVGNRINNLQGQINKLGNRMNAGMATSAAMANLLQPHKPGQSVATAGIGQHKNQSAVAVGYSRISDNGKYGVRFSMGANTQGEVTGGAAVGYFW